MASLLDKARAIALALSLPETLAPMQVLGEAGRLLHIELGTMSLLEFAGILVAAIGCNIVLAPQYVAPPAVAPPAARAAARAAATPVHVGTAAGYSRSSVLMTW